MKGMEQIATFFVPAFNHLDKRDKLAMMNLVFFTP